METRKPNIEIHGPAATHEYCSFSQANAELARLRQENERLKMRNSLLADDSEKDQLQIDNRRLRRAIEWLQSMQCERCDLQPVVPPADITDLIRTKE